MSQNLPRESQFLVYESENGQMKIEVRLEDETVWLTQQLMAELFQTTKQNVGQHLKNVFAEGELRHDSVVKKSFTTAADGKQYLEDLRSAAKALEISRKKPSAKQNGRNRN